MFKTTASMIAVVLAAGVVACDRHPAPADGIDNGKTQTGTADPGAQATNGTTTNGTTGNSVDTGAASLTTGGTGSGAPGRGGAGGFGGFGGTTVSPVGRDAR